eukprot:664806-Pleurochrysis_carterae.AAC.1
MAKKELNGEHPKSIVSTLRMWASRLFVRDKELSVPHVCSYFVLANLSARARGPLVGSARWRALPLALLKHVEFSVMNDTTAYCDYPKQELLADVDKIKGNSHH